jgi:HlyD family secretion protein
MSLDQLTTPVTPSTDSPRAGRSLRAPAWLLPGGLFAGFALVFLLIFGSRLLPAVPVRTAPVITLRSDPGSPAETGSTSPPAARTSSISDRTALLFQASGWIEPDPYTIYVPSLINGVINEVHVLEGATVKAGQLLATLVDDDARLDVQEAGQRIDSINSTRDAHCAAIPIIEAQRTAAQKKVAAQEARLAEFEDTAARLKAVTKGAISETDLIKARFQVTGQIAAVEEAKAEIPRFAAELDKIDEERQAIEKKLLEAKTDLARKQLALARTRITAPIDGVILRLHAAPGMKRMLTMDDPKSAVIVELYDPGKLQARIDVPLNEAAGLRIGQPVKISTDLLPDLEFRGTVTRMVGEADVQRNTLQAKVEIHNPDPRLRPEMLVRAEFFPLPPGAPHPPSSRQGPAAPSSASGRLALYAPKAALFDQSGTLAKTWIVADNRAQLREVTITNTERDHHLLVTDGLHSGDHLILPPHDRLKPNARVRRLEN